MFLWIAALFAGAPAILVVPAFLFYQADPAVFIASLLLIPLFIILVLSAAMIIFALFFLLYGLLYGLYLCVCPSERKKLFAVQSTS